MEQDEIRYVLYHDPKSNRRLVFFVEGPAEVATLQEALRRAGAEAAAEGSSGHDFVLRPTQPSETRRVHLVTIKAGGGSGKSNIANLLWLAATDEGASAASESVDRDT
jgi:hypothetical protein